MNTLELHRKYAPERRLISTGFVLLLVLIGLHYVVAHPQFVVQAYEQPTKVFGSMIKGMAP